MEFVAVVLVSGIVSAMVSALVTYIIVQGLCLRQFDVLDKLYKDAVKEMQDACTDVLDKAIAISSEGRKR